MLGEAGIFATFVGLLAAFKAERRSEENAGYDEFILWLENKRHKELIDEINSNHILGLGIKSLLNNNHENLMEKLEFIEAAIAAVAGQIGGFKEISGALAPNSGLSHQAFSVIKQLNDSGGSGFLEIKHLGGVLYQILDASGKIRIDEPRFIEDDLNHLCILGLLIPDFNSQGHRYFKITRLAANLVETQKL